MPAPLFLVSRVPAPGSFLVERSRTTPLHADMMQESRREQDGRVEIASLLVLSGVDSFERPTVLRELAARYRRVEDLPSDLPPGMTLHRLVIGQNVVAARGLASLGDVAARFAPSMSHIAGGHLETWALLPAGLDGAAEAAQLQQDYRKAGIEAVTRLSALPAEEALVWRLLTERCRPPPSRPA